MIEQPPPYECLVWDYIHSDENVTANELDQVNQDFLFQAKMSMNKSAFLTEL